MRVLVGGWPGGVRTRRADFITVNTWTIHHFGFGFGFRLSSGPGRTYWEQDSCDNVLSGSPELLITGAVDAPRLHPGFFWGFCIFSGPAASAGISVTAIGSRGFSAPTPEGLILYLFNTKTVLDSGLQIFQIKLDCFEIFINWHASNDSHN